MISAGENARYICSVILVMEQTHAGECHSNAVFVAAFDDEVVTNGTAGLCDIINAALLCAFDVIGEGEECVGTEYDTGDGCEICICFFLGEGFGASGKVVLPYAFCANVFFVLVDVTVDDVIAVCSAEGGKERKVQNLFMRVVILVMPISRKRHRLASSSTVQAEKFMPRSRR